MKELSMVASIAAEKAGITADQAQRFLLALAEQDLGDCAMAGYWDAPRKDGQAPHYGPALVSMIKVAALGECSGGMAPMRLKPGGGFA